jgi:hypothetical protein
VFAVWSATAIITAPATDAARQWGGWGTALKPAAEHWILARKPLSEPTVAANVLKWSTGALNIDQSRIKPEREETWEPERYLCDSCAEDADKSANKQHQQARDLLFKVMSRRP